MTVSEFFQMPEDYKINLIYEYGSVCFYKGEKRQEDFDCGVPNNMHGPDSFHFFLSTKEIDESCLHPNFERGLDAESTPGIPVGENEERKYDFGDVAEFLKRIGWYGKQVFDSPGPDEEYMEEVYDEDGVSISICQAYEYYVVCGLDEEDYKSLEEAFREWRNIK